MNFREELRKSIPNDLTLTEKEKSMIRFRVKQSNPSKPQLKPVFVSVLLITIIGVLILPNLLYVPKEVISTIPTPMSESEQPLINLTEEQKRALHDEYVKIVDDANQLKLGLNLGVSPIEEFEESYWVPVDQFEKRIQRIVEEQIRSEQESVKDATPNLKVAITNANGDSTKGTFVVISGLFKEIEVTAKLKTKYIAAQNRYSFDGIDNVSTELVYKNGGEWEQTSFDAKILDGGRTYSIRIEGVFNYLDVSYEKAFTIEFYCDEEGTIS